MVSLDKILLYLTSINLCGRVRGLPRCHFWAYSTARWLVCRKIREMLYSTALRSNVCSVNQSPAQVSVIWLETTPLSQTMFIPSPTDPSTFLRRRSQTKPVLRSWVAKEVQAELKASLRFEQDLFPSSPSIAYYQRLSSVEYWHQSTNVEERALVAVVDLHALEVGTLGREKYSENLLIVQGGARVTDRKFHKNCDIFMRLHLQYVRVCSRVFKSFSVFCACEIWALCRCESVHRRQWSHKI